MDNLFDYNSIVDKCGEKSRCKFIQKTSKTGIDKFDGHHKGIGGTGEG